jgi:hypothetical protein
VSSGIDGRRMDMGSNVLTKWLFVTKKDFKILFKNRPLLLIFLGIIVALLALATFQGLVLKNSMFVFFDAKDYLPALPNYMIYFVIFASSLFMMNLGPVSFTNEYLEGTINRLKIQNVTVISMTIGKIVFFFLASVIQVTIFNIVATWYFWSDGNTPMNWSVNSLLIHILLWPLMMVVGAYVIYLIIFLIKGKSYRG